MAKYLIKKEFFPFSHFKPPISEGFLKMAVPFMKPPKLIYKDKEVITTRQEVNSFDGAKIECFLMSPKKVGDNAPCLIYIHGGGFVLPAAGYHYKNAINYAKRVGCKVWFINYRLAPRYSHPTFYEDCYFATCYLHAHAKEFGVDVNKIGIGGDSAGSTLSVGVMMMVKEREFPIKFLFQMLPYPFLDMRGVSESNKKYVDTPMWNSKLSKKITPMVKLDKSNANYLYFSPIEAKDFGYLPPAYVETAEFDCLHDDGIIYAQLLQNAGVRVTLNETQGTMHGFDIKQKAPTTLKALQSRIAFMREQFNK
ncbi:MAG: alpha/beta hydrolase [Clostridiales bacterium]|nr:alpha/beta hydrolase [Clostridiales bacterium]